MEEKNNSSASSGEIRRWLTSVMRFGTHDQCVAARQLRLAIDAGHLSPAPAASQPAQGVGLTEALPPPDFIQAVMGGEDEHYYLAETVRAILARQTAPTPQAQAIYQIQATPDSWYDVSRETYEASGPLRRVVCVLPPFAAPASQHDANGRAAVPEVPQFDGIAVCPFCAFFGELHSDTELAIPQHSVQCGSCGAEGSIESTAEEAIARWNNRIGPKAAAPSLAAPVAKEGEQPKATNGACSVCNGVNSLHCGHCDGMGIEPRKLVGYGDCKCILPQYCDGKCNPIWADQQTSAQADAPSPYDASQPRTASPDRRQQVNLYDAGQTRDPGRLKARHDAEGGA